MVNTEWPNCRFRGHHPPSHPSPKDRSILHKNTSSREARLWSWSRAGSAPEPGALRGIRRSLGAAPNKKAAA